MKKTVLITGACINTGVAIVEKFASNGYNVIFTGRDKERVAQAEKGYREKLLKLPEFMRWVSGKGRFISDN